MLCSFCFYRCNQELAVWMWRFLRNSVTEHHRHSYNPLQNKWPCLRLEAIPHYIMQDSLAIEGYQFPIQVLQVVGLSIKVSSGSYIKLSPPSSIDLFIKPPRAPKIITSQGTKPTNLPIWMEIKKWSSNNTTPKKLTGHEINPGILGRIKSQWQLYSTTNTHTYRE